MHTKKEHKHEIGWQKSVKLLWKNINGFACGKEKIKNNNNKEIVAFFFCK